MRALLVLVVLMTGCTVAPPTSAAPPRAPDAAAPGPLEVTLVDHHVVLLGAEWDVLCTQGGGPRIERTGALVPEGARRLRVTTELSPTYTPLQVGYSLDEAAVTWLPPVGPGTTTQEVALPPGAGETDALRWQFYYQLNLPAAPQDCYTGAGAGERAIRIEASP